MERSVDDNHKEDREYRKVVAVVINDDARIKCELFPRKLLPLTLFGYNFIKNPYLTVVTPHEESD